MYERSNIVVHPPTTQDIDGSRAAFVRAIANLCIVIADNELRCASVLPSEQTTGETLCA